MHPTINFIGAGRLGKTLAKLIRRYNAGCIKGICNATLASSQQAASFIGQGSPCQSITDLPKADITFITTPDDLIRPICESLSHAQKFELNSIITHCSGLLTTDVLISAREKGVRTVSIHPMHSFADPELSVETFKGTYCAIEGEHSAQQTIKEVFQHIGAIVFAIDPQQKTMYHVSGVMATNYLVTLSDNAIRCLQSAGIDKPAAADIVLHVMHATLQNLMQNKSPEESLTGPIKRGDVQTIEAHINALTLTDPLLKEVYLSLAKATLRLSNHPNTKKIHDLLKD